MRPRAYRGRGQAMGGGAMAMRCPVDVHARRRPHGFWTARCWLSPLAARLRAAGFAPRIWGYPSVFGGPERAIPLLVDALRAGPPVHLVGHSLGGLVALEALRRAPELPVGRV